jgi:hypothetical protein
MSLYDRRQIVWTVRTNETPQSFATVAAVAMHSDCFMHWVFYKQQNNRDRIWITSEECKNRLRSSTDQASKTEKLKKKSCRDETMLHNYMSRRENHWELE